MDFLPPKSIGKYIFKKQIGKGSYCKTFEANDTAGNEYCVKMIPKTRIAHQPDYIRLQKEINVLASLNHANIVTIYDVLENQDFYFLITEMCHGLTLLDLINSNYGLDEETAKIIFIQLLNVLNFLHDHGIFHRDIKLENMIVDDKYKLKLIDFGFSTVLLNSTDQMLTTFCGSLHYLSPEIIEHRPYHGAPNDMWSAGITLYAMVSAKLPWTAKGPAAIAEQIRTNNRSPLPPFISSECGDLIDGLLQTNPEQRLTASAAMKSPWFKGVSLPLIKTSPNVSAKFFTLTPLVARVRYKSSTPTPLSLNAAQNVKSMKPGAFNNAIPMTLMRQMPMSRMTAPQLLPALRHRMSSAAEER